MKRLKIYYENYCPYCQAALALLNDKNIQHEAIDTSGQRDLLNKIKKQTGHRTIPIILIDDELIGGYNELSKAISSGALNDRLQK